ncbi:MAG TPA: hypothetical protein VMT58_00940 [Candidatus Binataceae bacterium]|nr:hypothetical protein [Candidatus Binataceae bacterium]
MKTAAICKRFGRARLAAMFALTALLTTVGIAPPAHAQFFENYYPGYFTLLQPGRLDITMFGGGYISDKYGDLQQGIQVEQSVTPYVGVFGRASGYQLWEGEGFDNPLAPGTGHEARLNFGRLQGGVDLTLFPATHLYLSGGHDVGDSDGSVIEGDLSSWLFLHSQHPINGSFSAIHDFQNGVTSSEIDFQTIVFTTEKYLIMAGVGGAYYVGGFISEPGGSGTQGQGGPDLGFFYRPWQLGIGAQAGYGTAHQYGQITMYKQLSWFE